MGRVIKANALRNYQNYKNKILSPLMTNVRQVRSSSLVVFLGKGVLIICSKFRGENPYRNVVSIKLQSNFIEITLRHGSYPVNLVHFIRTTFPKNTSGGLFLMLQSVLFLASYRVQEQSPGGDL